MDLFRRLRYKDMTKNKNNKYSKSHYVLIFKQLQYVLRC